MCILGVPLVGHTFVVVVHIVVVGEVLVMVVGSPEACWVCC